VDHAERVKNNVSNLIDNKLFAELSKEWFEQSIKAEYSYNFEWLGRPLIQYPTDLVGMQEVFFKTKPDLVIETGIAHGGSLIFSASMMALMDICDGVSEMESARHVIGVDIDIKPHNRRAIEEHPLFSRITLLEGSSVDQSLFSELSDIAKNYKRIMVILDSNHTHDHVLEELRMYSELVSVGNYCIVMDTVIETSPIAALADRPWTVGNNPMTAVKQFLAEGSNFAVDKEIEYKLSVTVAPNGWLRRTI
jgi:cephalosporin hydroxylase